MQYPEFNLADHHDAECCLRKRRLLFGLNAIVVVTSLSVDIAGCNQSPSPADANLNQVTLTSDLQNQMCTPSTSGCKCCNESYEGASQFVSPWLDRKVRQSVHIRQEFVDQLDKRNTFQERVDRPTAVLFFFTRCDNPLKCSRSVAIIGRLQKELQKRQVDSKTRLLLITLEPHVDTPQLMKDYCGQRGISFEQPGTDVLVPDRETYSRFLNEVAAPVGYANESVNVHDVGLLLFDRDARFVRQYRHNLENIAAISADMTRLVEE